MSKAMDVINYAMSKMDSSQDIKTNLNHPFIKYLNVDFSALSTVQNAMQTIETCLELLSDVKDFMSRALYSIKEESRKRQGNRDAGITSIPPEIFAIILSYISEGDHFCDPTKIIAFSQTCRLFREIALGIPSLWAVIDFERTMKENVSFLTRSGPAGLSITFSTEDVVSVEELRSFIQMLLPHRQRWKSFRVTVPEINYRPLLREIGQQCAHISLPELCELTIEYNNHRLYEDSLILELDDSGMEFFSTWTVQQLRYMAVKNYLPMAVPSALSVTDLSIEISMDDRRDVQSHEFTRFLQSLPNVKTLKILFRCVSFIGPCEVPICLSKLQNLTLNLNGDSAPFPSVVQQKFLDLFEFPAVRSLTTVGDFDRSADLGPWLRMLLTGPRFPNLTDLNINYHVYEGAHCGIDDMFRLVPKLKCLDVKIEEDRSLSLDIDVYGRYKFPPLQTMRFDIPGKFNWSDISDLTGRLLKLYGRGTEDLKRLSIVGRPDIANHLENLFSVDNVKAVFDA